MEFFAFPENAEQGNLVRLQWKGYAERCIIRAFLPHASGLLYSWNSQPLLSTKGQALF